LCVIKKPRKRGGYSPARGLQNTKPLWVVATGEKKMYPMGLSVPENGTLNAGVIG